MGSTRRLRRALASLIVLAAAFAVVGLRPAAAQPAGGYSFEFLDFQTRQITKSFPFRRPTEIILASQTEDVRRLLPITFTILIDGKAVFEQRATDPVKSCRGPTGCSVTGPSLQDPGPNSRVEIVARSESGTTVRFTREPVAAQPSPSPTPTRVTTREKTPPATTERPRTTERPPVHEDCWWCWGLKLLFVATLVCILIHHIIREEWWDWWFLWFILIFIWIPFFFLTWTGLAPGWWWFPLLIWIPTIGFFAWRMAYRRPRWALWIWPLAMVWTVAVVAGLGLIGIKWWFLLPMMWLPWVAIYLFGRGARRPWWRWWLFVAVIGYVMFVFAWFIWLGPLWGWVIPVLVISAFAGWMLFWWGKSKKEWWGPKLCFVLPWAWFPWFAFMNFEWDPWWCWVFIGFFVSTLLCVLFHFVRKTRWWVWWGFWLIFILVWIPLLLAALVFFDVWWWWIPLLAWFPAILLAVLFGGWFRRWWVWGLVALWWIAIGAGLWFLQPVCWFLLPVFWLPWILIYLLARGFRQPWWRWWLLIPIALYVAWIFIWICWLTPSWWWVLAALVPLGLAFWFVFTKQKWNVVTEKLCFFLPWALVPLFALAFFIDCYQPADRVVEGTRLRTVEKARPRTTEKARPKTTSSPARQSPSRSPSPKPFSIGEGPKPAEAQFDNPQGTNCLPPFRDNSFTVETRDGQVIIFQGQTNETVSGPIDPNGAFNAASEAETFTGKVGTGSEPNTFQLTADYKNRARGCSYQVQMLIRS
jgi:hypothetical protein